MEYAQGGSLFDYCNQNRLSESHTRFFARQLLEGIKHMHEAGVCHRDLKPDNLLLICENDDCVLKITDFGVAGPVAGWDESEFLTTYCGTKAFMAPEVLNVEKEAGALYEG